MCVRVGWHTFDGIRLGQLRALLHQLLGQGVPCLLGREAQVDVRGGEVVGVELSARTFPFLTLSFTLPFLFCRPFFLFSSLSVGGGPGGGGKRRTYPVDSGVLDSGLVKRVGREREVCRHQISQSQPNLISSSSAGGLGSALGASASAGAANGLSNLSLPT